MKNTNKPQKSFEPSEDEILETAERVNKRYDIVLREEDAKKLAKLYKEIEWWFMVEKFTRNHRKVSIETAKEVRDYFEKVKGKDMTLDEAQEFAKSAYEETIASEKERIAKAIKELIKKYQI